MFTRARVVLNSVLCFMIIIIAIMINDYDSTRLRCRHALQTDLYIYITYIHKHSVLRALAVSICNCCVVAFVLPTL